MLDRTIFLLSDIDRAQLRALQDAWRQLMVFGTVMCLLGLVALIFPNVATLATNYILGWVLLIAGVLQAMHSFQIRGWRRISLME